ncbi:hypothetical protein Ciccas_002408 [Cichlidogyrus casuarinus]|uniref:MULE transposase domain-containing protein n=1 Tax=Cichlidogyrus casuarinus TaxID=1844966 RepID=A0ABD2QHA3_9PLAT
MEYVFIRTSAMKAMSKHPRSSLLVAMDTTYGICDNYVLTMIITSVPGGSYPLCMMFHKKENAEAYCLLLLFLIASDPCPFGGQGMPKYILTDDSKAESSAIESILHESEHILCLVHVLRNIRGYPCLKGHKASFEKLASTAIISTNFDQVKSSLEEIAKLPTGHEGAAILLHRLEKSCTKIFSIFRPTDIGFCFSTNG